MRNWLTVLGLSLTLTACGDKDDDTGGGGDDGGDGHGDHMITPTEGEWGSGDETVLSDTCGFDDGDDDSGEPEEEDNAVITMTGEDTFTLSIDDDYSCTVTDHMGTFECEALVTETDFTADGYDAVISVAVTIAGQFSSTTEGMVNFTVDATCEGADCETLAGLAGLTLPCSTQVEFNVYHAG